MPNTHSPAQNSKVVLGFSSAITAAAVTSPAIDTVGFDRAMVVFYGAPTGAGTTEDGKVQECATSGGSYVDVPGATITQITTAGGAQLYVMDINLTKRLRFLKVVGTGAGGSAAGTAFATVELSRGRHLPVTQANTVIEVN